MRFVLFSFILMGMLWCKFIPSTNATVEVSPITGGTITPLTDAATIVWAANQGYAYSVTLGGNRAVANPSDLTIGAVYFLMITQDGTGSRTLTWGSNYLFPASSSANTAIGSSDYAVPPVLSTWPGSKTLLQFFSNGTQMILTATTKDVEGFVGVPTTLAATQNVVGQVNLTWVDTTSDETGFQIFRQDEFGDYLLLTTTAANAVSYSDTGGSPDPGVTYLVRAIRGADRGNFSNGAVGFEL